MANFEVTLSFVEITPATPVPRGVDLLFYDAAVRHMARGWADDTGRIILIGAQWQPTHYAEHFYPIAKAAKAAQFAADVAACPACQACAVEGNMCHKHALQRPPQYAPSGRFPIEDDGNEPDEPRDPFAGTSWSGGR